MTQRHRIPPAVFDAAGRLARLGAIEFVGEREGTRVYHLPKASHLGLGLPFVVVLSPNGNAELVQAESHSILAWVKGEAFHEFLATD